MSIVTDEGILNVFVCLLAFDRNKDVSKQIHLDIHKSEINCFNFQLYVPLAILNVLKKLD